MLKEWKWSWRAGRVRKSLAVRFSIGTSYWDNPLRLFLQWLLRGLPWERWSAPAGVELRTRLGGQHNCYCPTGTMTKFGVEAFGISVYGWLSRDWTPKPCHCDKVIWLCFPENHEEEIEEYGLDKLRAEYPGLASQAEHPAGCLCAGCIPAERTVAAVDGNGLAFDVPVSLTEEGARDG